MATPQEAERILAVYRGRQTTQTPDVIERQGLALVRSALGNLSGLHILDMGCGSGYWLRQFVRWGATPELLTGIDIIPERIAQARQTGPFGARYICGDATTHGVANGSQDIVMQMIAVSSILDDEIRKRFATAMRRAVKPTGTILWYDMQVNNPRNPNVRGVRESELHRLFPGTDITCTRALIWPGLARRVPRAYRFLARHSPVRTHLLATIRQCTSFVIDGNTE